MIWCVLCLWRPDPMAAPLAVYRPKDWLPIAWDGSNALPTVVSPAGQLTDWPEVALVYHWSQAHPDLLRQLIGEYEVDRWPRPRGSTMSTS